MTARAPHSFAGTYHEDKTVKIEGKLVQFLFRNPHSFVHVEARDENGEMQRFAVEWASSRGRSSTDARAPADLPVRSA